ncbi:UNC-50 family [Plasmodiophora brassicae]
MISGAEILEIGAGPPRSPSLSFSSRGSTQRRFSLSRPRSLFGMAPEYLQRILSYNQMDFQYACSQMVSLCRSPSAVYKSTKLRKQIKNQWARDDPAFVVIVLFFMTVSAVSFSIAFGFVSVWHFARLVLGAVLFDFLGIGAFIATVGWYLANQYMRVQRIITIDQTVEWLYAFDIHCNAFFPVFLLLYVLQFYLSPLLLAKSFLSTLFANTLYAAAFCYYHYVSFLGYNALPFLQNTQWFLYPTVLIAAAYVLSLLFQFNVAYFFLHIPTRAARGPEGRTLGRY